MIRHASIIDNLLPDTQIAGPKGTGHSLRRQARAREHLAARHRRPLDPDPVPRARLQGSGARDRGDADPAEDLGAAEAVLIYPEGTRATAKKIARAKEIIRERNPEVSPLAEQLENLLPPRLGGPLALLESGQGMDVLFFAHVGFDGFEYVSDIWAGGLIGRTIRMKMWRVPAAEIPADEQGRTEWLYSNWQRMDRWISENAAELGHTPAGKSGATPPSQEPAAVD